MSDDTAAWLTGEDADQPTATGTIPGTDHEITVVDVTEAQLDALEGDIDDAEADMEAKKAAIRDFLVKPDVDPDDMPLRRRNLLWAGMFRIWSGADDIGPAMDELQVPEGNG